MPARGFTLIEVLVVVAIVSVLAAIAWPMHLEQVARGRRLQAQLHLMEAAQYLQRYHASNGTYGEVVLPDSLARSPHDGQALYFVEATVDPSGQAYLLSAVPQAGFAADRCGTLLLRSTGQKGNAPDQPVSACWR